MTMLYPRRAYWKEYCSSYYWVSTYKHAYMGHIMLLMLDMSDWPVNCDLDRQIMSSPHFRGIGRPKKARTIGKDEEVNPKKKMRICSKCKQPGHNAKTCKGLPAAKKECEELAPTKASKESSAASTLEPPTLKANSKVFATKSNAVAAPKSTLSSSSSTPQPAAETTTLIFEPTRAPEQRHTFGDFLAKQLAKSSTSVLAAAQVAFTDGGTVRAPIATKRPRPFKLPGPAS
ncbi:hypothetical protein IFM89_003691 [Coptis chinensis]|uniref:CCHC-type domain-containing protein n=1 Tax=Coptis chinensis TaxID=261450 RepID=A0A835IU25_9MAGN|nr:hypothetical protein IFM89_003691 [Coptis chinensis]